ncbi:SDR family oxidoreductase [Bacillaceae bacterium SIJ1]|uniref:SDR family NAD(P)-dependent oxidoreductase n=1 Tax=Litoribacterium kuwaitense TaxID=1398745 RepID=UPI0013EA5910|nr:SDR family oxidoreductase [Litoribacterium kuwaitense]NGP43635.1 SDR family oxidoreductase [Litoribacterium kuwaitense]
MQWRPRLICITGATGGIGSALAMEAAKAFDRIVLMGRSLDKLQMLRSQLPSSCAVYLVTADLEKSDDITQAFASISKEVGEIDVLINNAGIGRFLPFEQLKREEIERMVNINVNAVFTSTQAVLPAMMRRKRGHIITVASQAARLPTPKATVYAATKYAVLGFSDALRMEVQKDGILVTTVNPGPVQTPFFANADPDGTYAEKMKPLMLERTALARSIVGIVGKRRREVNKPWWMHVGAKLYQGAPSVVETLFSKQFHSK